MSQGIQKSVREPIWMNIIFFTVTTLVAVIGTPLYLLNFETTVLDWGLFFFYVVATGMSITVGYHRLFAHRTFKAHPIIEFLILFFGAAAFEQSAFAWASQHRDHHKHVDTDLDPYSIKKGFWYAHIGWLVMWRHPKNFENAHDLQKNKMVMNQHQHYLLWSSCSGIILPVLIGALMGNALGAFILAVCLRLTFVYHSTFCINSVCHMFGKPTYDIYSSAKDHWFVAFLTNGEGYHNFHHRFPNDYRNGVRWYQWDPSKWLINLLSKIGLVSELKRVSDFRIMEARLAAENQRASDWIKLKVRGNQFEHVHQTLEHQYHDIRRQLFAWETAMKEYREVFHEQLTVRSEELQKSASKNLELARERFQAMQERWKSFQVNQLGLALI